MPPSDVVGFLRNLPLEASESGKDVVTRGASKETERDEEIRRKARSPGRMGELELLGGTVEAMVVMRIGSIALICGLLLGACATVPAGPSVMALPGAGKSFEQFQADDLVCRQWASQQTGTTPEHASGLSTAEGAGLGTLIGAGLGAAIGAAAGNPGLGAAVGAGGGLLAGTAVGARAGQGASYQLQHRYDNAYEQCMYAKGDRVPAVAPPEPAASIPPPSQPRR